MRHTGSEVGSWAAGDKGTVLQGAQAACHPRRWSCTTPRSRLQARPHLHRMRLQGSSVPPALWVLGCLTLLLWLWVLCTACNRKQSRRQLSRLQGSAMPAEVSLLRRPHHCSLSKSDTRLHELHRSRPCSRAPRPASMDLLCPQWLEASRGGHPVFQGQQT
uniref:Lck interacting transmembrane adaptor 1 n=1 Tax=Ovis aries TaxID=9940 RepID=A0AC11DJE5_SHEEP